MIATTLSTLVPAGSTPYIDMDYGQLELKERPDVTFPCVLIDFQDWEFKDLSNFIQQGAGNVILKLATNPYSASSNITPLTYIQDSINIFELEYAIYKALQGFKPNIMNDSSASATGLSRIMLRSDNRRPGLKVRILPFRTSFQDNSAKPAPVSTTASPNITATFTEPG